MPKVRSFGTGTRVDAVLGTEAVEVVVEDAEDVRVRKMLHIGTQIHAVTSLEQARRQSSQVHVCAVYLVCVASSGQFGGASVARPIQDSVWF